MYKELYEGTWPIISCGFVSSIRADFMYVRFREMRTLTHVVLYCTVLQFSLAIHSSYASSLS